MKLARPGVGKRDRDSVLASTPSFKRRLEAARPVSLSLVLARHIMLIRGEDDDELELAWMAADGASALVVNVRVALAAFCGTTETWVGPRAWIEFVREFKALEKSRSRHAVLEGISPDELRIRIFIVDRAGHVAVDGFVGYRGADSALAFDGPNSATLVRGSNVVVDPVFHKDNSIPFGLMVRTR